MAGPCDHITDPIARARCIAEHRTTQQRAKARARGRQMRREAETRTQRQRRDPGTGRPIDDDAGWLKSRGRGLEATARQISAAGLEVGAQVLNAVGLDGAGDQLEEEVDRQERQVRNIPIARSDVEARQKRELASDIAPIEDPARRERPTPAGLSEGAYDRNKPRSPGQLLGLLRAVGENPGEQLGALANLAVDSAPYTAVTIGPAAVSKAAGLVTAAGLETGMQLRDAATDPATGGRRDVTPRAGLAAVVSGVASAGFEVGAQRVLLGRINRELVAASIPPAARRSVLREVRDGMTRAAGDVGGQAFTEGGTEALQTIIQNAGARVGWDASRALTEGVAESFAVGAITGGAMQAPVSNVNMGVVLGRAFDRDAAARLEMAADAAGVDLREAFAEGASMGERQTGGTAPAEVQPLASEAPPAGAPLSDLVPVTPFDAPIPERSPDPDQPLGERAEAPPEGGATAVDPIEAGDTVGAPPEATPASGAEEAAAGVPGEGGPAEPGLDSWPPQWLQDSRARDGLPPLDPTLPRVPVPDFARWTRELEEEMEEKRRGWAERGLVPAPDAPPRIQKGEVEIPAFLRRLMDDDEGGDADAETPPLDPDWRELREQEALDDAPDAPPEVTVLETTTPEASGETGDSRVQTMRVRDLEVDPARFQPRDDAFSDESVERIVSGFDERELDPLRTWVDPSDGKTYVLAGHSRREAIRRLQDEGKLPEDYQVPVDPYTGSEAEARDFAGRENSKGTAQTPSEDAAALRVAIDGMSRTAGREEATTRYGRNGALVYALSRLSPTGKAVQDLRAFGKARTKEARDVLTMAQWLGLARDRYENLTDSHERELYEWIRARWGTSGAPRTQVAWMQFVDEVLSRRSFMGTFDASQPLNLAELPANTTAEIDAVIAEADRALKDAQRERRKQEKDYTKRGATGEQLAAILKPFDEAVRAAQREALRVREEAGRARGEAENQMGLFGAAPEAEPPQASGDSPGADAGRTLDSDTGTATDDSATAGPQEGDRVRAAGGADGVGAVDPGSSGRPAGGGAGAAGARAADGDARGVGEDAGADPSEQGGARVPAGDAAAAGAAGDRGVSADTSGPEGRAASDRESERGDASREEGDGADGPGGAGALLDPATAPTDLDERASGLDLDGAPRRDGLEPEPLAPEAPTLQDRLEQQAEADRTSQREGVRLGDAGDVRRSLPILLDAQKEDVVKAERRFFGAPTSAERKAGEDLEDPRRGILFTNATGTGKTYTGLGIIKRLVLDGKADVLIVVPTDQKAKDWIEDAQNLDLDVAQLESTKDSGEGVVVTTYANMGQNNALLYDRTFDLVVYDESHRLMQNADGSDTSANQAHLQLTNHPKHAVRRVANSDPETRAALERVEEARGEMRKLHPRERIEQSPLWRERTAELEAAQEAYAPLYRARVADDAVQAEAAEAIERTRAVFLSATPFAYHKTLQYADGYLFTSPVDADRQGEYNQAQHFDLFLQRHLAYYMKTGRLNAPPPDVDTSLMERELHERFRNAGAISGRALELEQDYSRDFYQIESRVGEQIDDGLDFLWLRRDDYDAYGPAIRSHFSYLYKTQLLESIKARESIERVRQHLAMGRKVVVFHSYNENSPGHPFRITARQALEGRSADMTRQDYEKLRQQIERFKTERPDLWNLDLSGLEPVQDVYRKAFGDRVAMFNGTVSKRLRAGHVREFNEDGSGLDVLVVQMEAGKEGISLHDTTGGHQRVMMNLGLPTRPTDAIQSEGRVYRFGNKSDAIFEYPVTGLTFEQETFANKVASRSTTAENLALGNEARALQVAFTDGYMHATDQAPGPHQGTGGKEADRFVDESTPFDKAKTLYYARGKTSKRNKGRDGVDYYATPEPIGLMMVEWLQLGRGDRFLEPSAGHGAIARFVPEGTSSLLIEPSYRLAGQLRLNTSAPVQQSRFEDLHLVNKFEGIAMNPPYGTGGKTAMEHVAKAAKHLAPGGRLIAIVPDGPSMAKRLDTWMESKEGERVVKVADVGLPSVTFKNAATSVRTRIVVFDRPWSQEDRVMIETRGTRDLAADTIEELFDRIENVTMPKRRPKPPEPEASGEFEFETTAPSGDASVGAYRDVSADTPVVPTPEASGVLLAPNGKPSNLNPLQYQLVRTPAFKDWFGDWENDPENASKVLNENGEPAVVYHGTSGNFDLFSEQSRRGTGVRRTERIAYYFTSSPAVANSFADRSALFDPGDANVMPVFLSLKRPEIVDADGASIDDLEQPLSESGDGVLIRNVHDYHSEFAIGKPESTVYAAFGASQIKSATGNSGGFSAASPNINASVGTYRDVAPEASGAAPASRAPATLTVTIDGRTYSQELGGLDAVKSVEMPELVRIARSLMGDVPHMGTGRMDANGLFRTRGVDVPSGAAQDVDARGGAKKAVAQVRIQPELFRNTTMAAQVLAHEIGHLVDFVPDETMKRGNLGGRLRSLLGYMKSTVERSDGRSGSVLTSKDRSKLRREARKAVLDREGIRPKDYAADAATRQRLADPIAAEYQSRVSAEVKSRNLVDVGTLTEELWAFSSYWRPVPAGADETYMRYRKSSRELYADALSGLLIAPSELQSRAPTFYQAFFEGLAADKPEVQKVYEEVQLLLARGPEAIAQSRMEDVYGMFEDADRRKALLEEAADAERKQEYRTQLVQSLVTRWHPILERAKRLEKKGTPLAEDPRYLLEEVGMADSPASVYLADVAETVLQPLKAAGLTERDLATWMFLNRVEKEREVRLAEDKLPKEVIEALTGTGLLTRDVQAAELEDLPEEIRAIVQAAAVDTGGRSNMANPLGFTEETARATREHLEAMVGEDGARALRRAQRVFVDLTTPILDEAADLGVLNKEWWETAGKPNRYAYATFRVLDFVGEAHRASVGVKQQRGTFRDVDDVFAATMGKALATIRENVRQRAKLAVKDMMAAHFADEWERPRASGPGRYAPPKNRTLRGVLYIWENGRQRPYYTDRYVADSFRQMDLRGLRWLAATMRFLNAPFRAGFITYNLTFGLWTNPIRDARRVAKALAIKGKKASYRQVIQRYATESKAAWAYARGRVSDPRVRELLASGAMMPPGESVMFVDRGDGLRKTAERYGMAPPAKRGRLLSMVSRLGSSVRLVNRFTEALPKFAAWKILQEQGIDGRERAWRVRTQVGTPNVTDGGRAKELTNSVFMFSNVFTQGWRSDAMLATRPETRGGFVFRTIVLDVVPKLVMKAAQAGLLATATAAVLGVGEDDEENNFGAWLKTFYSHVGRYDMGSYMVIPLGYAEDASSPSGKKARYLRVPHDESSRAVVGALWRLFDDEPDAVAAMASAFDFGGGQVPGFAPAIGLGSTWADYLGGANPRDDFYGRDVISRRAHEARQAGDHGPALAEMTGHTVDEFGVTRFQWRDKSGVNAVPFLNRVVKETSWGLIEEDREQEDREAGRKASVRAAYDMETQARYREMYRLRRDGAEERERHGTSELYQRLLDWHREAYRYYDELANEARTHDDTEGERQARRALEAATREYFGDL